MMSSGCNCSHRRDPQLPMSATTRPPTGRRQQRGADIVPQLVPVPHRAFHIRVALHVDESAVAKRGLGCAPPQSTVAVHLPHSARPSPPSPPARGPARTASRTSVVETGRNAVVRSRGSMPDRDRAAHWRRGRKPSPVALGDLRNGFEVVASRSATLAEYSGRHRPDGSACGATVLWTDRRQ